MAQLFKNIVSHGAMLSDKVRLESYRKAIYETVKRGDIVCDIGSGSGILAFFALQAGAEKVYAIEQHEIIEEAKELAQLNGLEKRINFIKNRSDKVELPEKVDVIISELIGYFGIEESLHRFKIDARDRFLKLGGRLLPHCLELYLAPVQFNEFWDKQIGLWDKDFYGFDFSPVKESIVNERHIRDCTNKMVFMANPALISHLDFYQISNISLVYHSEFTVNKDGYLHGLLGYFKAGLSINVILSTSPEDRVTHWGQSFFPFQESFLAKKEDKIFCKVKAIPDSGNVFWQWDADILRNGAKIAGFSQSNFKIDKEELIVGRNDFKPHLTRDSEIMRRILNLCDGSKTIEEIAEIVFKEYPENLKDARNAMREVIGAIRGKVKT